MKKAFSIAPRLSALFFFGCLCILLSLTSHGAGEEDYIVETEGGGAYITAYIGSSEKVVIPDSFSSFPTLGIRPEGFKGCDITSVTLPAGVEYVGDEAFAECTRLASVTFGGDTLTLGKGAFRACTSLCDISLPTIDVIDDFTFFGCSSLSEINIPEGVGSIGLRAFYGCALKKVMLPSTLDHIGEYAFMSCTELSDIKISEKNYTYSAYSSLIVSNGAAVYLPEGVHGDYSIRANIISIGRAAFFQSSISSLTVTDGIKQICDRAFYSSSVTTLRVTDAVDSIGYDAFSECNDLTLYCIENSECHNYALGNGIPYSLVSTIYQKGDADGDGVISMLDILTLDSYLTGTTAYLKADCDMNGDGVIDDEDVKKVFEIIKKINNAT